MGMCAPLTAEELAPVAEIKANRRTLQPGAELYCQGEVCPNYFILVEGWVAARATVESGSFHIPDFALPGAFLGYQPASGRAMTHSAVCVTRVVVCVLPRRRLDELVAGSAKLASRLLHLAACYEARVRDHFVNVSGRAARERVAHLMVELFFRVHRHLPSVRGETACIPLTLDQLGQALGLTGVHVNRTLRVLREEGILHFARRTLEIVDPDALMAAAGYPDRVAVSAQDELLRDFVD